MGIENHYRTKGIHINPFGDGGGGGGGLSMFRSGTLQPLAIQVAMHVVTPYGQCVSLLYYCGLWGQSGSSYFQLYNSTYMARFFTA